MPTVATVGVYGFTAETFLATLRKAKVKVVLDVRQRRGVRGAEYSWANAVRLQAALADAGIEYRHLRDLAPTTAMRELQYREDSNQGVGKRSRVELAPRTRVSTRPRSSTRSTSTSSSTRSQRRGSPRCSASSATLRRAIGRSSPIASRRSTA